MVGDYVKVYTREDYAMATRTTMKNLDDKVALINDVLESKGDRRRVMVQHAYGRPRAHIVDMDNLYGGTSDLSPRLPMGEMLRWLRAFYTGLTFVK